MKSPRQRKRIKIYDQPLFRGHLDSRAELWGSFSLDTGEILSLRLWLPEEGWFYVQATGKHKRSWANEPWDADVCWVDTHYMSAIGSKEEDDDIQRQRTWDRLNQRETVFLGYF